MADRSDHPQHEDSDATSTGAADGPEDGRTAADVGFASAPAFLFDSPVTSPQFENVGQWEADPLLECGTDAYVDGEYLYQDYVYDDKGAATGEEPLPPAVGRPQPVPNPSIVSNSTGRAVYPTDDERFGHNAADLLEFRTRPVEEGTAYRVTLQTMKEPAVAAVAIGIDTGGESGTDDWGYGIGSLGPLSLDHVLVTWGTGAELDGEPLADDRVSVDVERNQIEVTAPLEPGEETWRHYAVVGLFDADSREFLEIRDQPTEDHPGGARGEDIPPIFNVAFRFDEPMGVADVPDGLVPGRDPSGHDRDAVYYGQWREHAQAVALWERDISEFGADVDFGALRAGVTESDAPETGYCNRVYASRYDIGEGIRREFGGGARTSEDRELYDLLRNRVQPYGLYVPSEYDPEEAHPLHVQLHGGQSSHNSVARKPNMLEQFGDQRNALVLSPGGRGPGVFYRREGELDVLEALADVIARFNVDLDRITIGGVSMGGGGTFQLASRYPDLFAKAFPIVGGCWPGWEPTMDSLRNIPVLMWNGLVDELANPGHYLPTVAELQKRGYRHEIGVFFEDGHLDSSRRDEWAPAKAFLDGEYLGEDAADRFPSHVTHTRMLDKEYEPLDLRHDGAYWVDDVRLTDGRNVGTVDVRTVLDGEAPPRRRQPPHIFPAEQVSHYSGVDDDPANHVYFGTEWLDGTEAADIDDGLDVTLEGVSEATFSLEGTDLDTGNDLTLDVETDHPATLTLRAETDAVEVSIPRGSHRRTVSLEE